MIIGIVIGIVIGLLFATYLVLTQIARGVWFMCATVVKLIAKSIR